MPAKMCSHTSIVLCHFLLTLFPANYSLFNNSFMFYLVTIFDTEASAENPVKPRSVVVESSNMSLFLGRTVDATHYVAISIIDVDGEA